LFKNNEDVNKKFLAITTFVLSAKDFAKL